MKIHERQLPAGFLEMFQNEDQLKPILDCVVNDDNYCFELRGEYVVIYYRGGALFTIKYKDEGYTIRFNKDYYKKDYVNNDAIDKFMADLGDEMSCKEAVKNIYYFKHIMDCYFAYTSKKERQAQQECVRVNNRGKETSNATDLFVLDIEYAFNGNISDAAIVEMEKLSKKEQKEINARFDMLMLDWPSTKSNRSRRKDLGLAFVELKYGDGAMKGSAGIKKHIEDYVKFVSDIEKVEDLCSDMEVVYRQKKELGLIIGEKGAKSEIHISRDSIKMIFGFIEHDPDKSGAVSELRKCIQHYEGTEYGRWLDTIYVAKASDMGYGFYAYKGTDHAEFMYPMIKEYIEE